MNVLSEFQEKKRDRDARILQLFSEFNGQPMAVYRSISLALYTQGIRVTPERVRQIIISAKKEGRI